MPTAKERSSHQSLYTHISNQYAPFHTKVINSPVRDATHVLDGLLYHESELRIEEHLGLTQKATPERGNELLRSDVNPKRSQGS
jgi:hypothetical protein